ncbi:MAG: hypothetical protein IPL35_05345 [Sphingobacteriales bacterium]|nr:hypothetical protein [Sphingobacteriales bacterium]
MPSHTVAANGFGLAEVGEIEVQMFKRRTALEPTTKLSYEALNPPLRQTAVSSCPSCLSCLFVVISCLFFVRWLGGSFAKLGFSVGWCAFANVPPNTLAMYLVCYQMFSLSR